MAIPQIDTARIKRYILRMLGLSAGHIVVLIVILLLVGPKRIPEVSQNLGKAIKNLKDALDGVQEPSFRRLDDQNQASNQQTTDTPPPPNSQPRS